MTSDNERLERLSIIFDLDGTLIDTAGDLAAAMNAALANDGLSAIPTNAVRHMVGFGAKAMLREGYKHHGITPENALIETRLADFLEHYNEHIDDFSRPFPHAEDALLELQREGASLAVCTNKRESPAKLLLARLKLDKYFVRIVGGDTAEQPKPHPAPVLLAAGDTILTNVIFIGDSDTDISAAQATGVKCIVGTFGYGPLEQLEESIPTFSDYSVLVSLIRDVASI
ncbi:MAG: HAD-IA family hydrolase [Pseudomonadota bacterium]